MRWLILSAAVAAVCGCTLDRSRVSEREAVNFLYCQPRSQSAVEVGGRFVCLGV